MTALKKVIDGAIALTEREMSLLAVSVTEMIQNGLDPFNQRYIIQLVP